MAEPLSLALCSLSTKKDAYGDLIEHLKSKCAAKVEYICLQGQVRAPTHDFLQYDGVILVHSVHLGRCSITDVPEARFNILLPHLRDTLGAERVALLVTETDDMNIQQFLREQPTAKDCAGCIELSNQVTDPAVLLRIVSFLSQGALGKKPRFKKRICSKPSSIVSVNPQAHTIHFGKSKLCDNFPNSELEDVDIVIWTNECVYNALIHILKKLNDMDATVLKCISGQWKRIDFDVQKAHFKCIMVVDGPAGTSNRFLVDKELHEIGRLLKGATPAKEKIQPWNVENENEALDQLQQVQIDSQSGNGIALTTATSEPTAEQTMQRGVRTVTSLRDAEKKYQEQKLQREEKRSLENIIFDLKQDIQKNTEQNRALEIQISEKENTIKTLKEDEKAIKVQIAKSGQHNKILNNEKSTLQQKVKSLKKEKHDLEQLLEKQHKQHSEILESLQQDINTLDVEIIRKKDDKEKAGNELRILKTEIKDIEKLENELHESQRKIDELETRNKELETELNKQKIVNEKNNYKDVDYSSNNHRHWQNCAHVNNQSRSRYSIQHQDESVSQQHLRTRKSKWLQSTEDQTHGGEFSSTHCSPLPSISEKQYMSSGMSKIQSVKAESHPEDNLTKHDYHATLATNVRTSKDYINPTRGTHVSGQQSSCMPDMQYDYPQCANWERKGNLRRSEELQGKNQSLTSQNDLFSAETTETLQQEGVNSKDGPPNP